MNTYADAIRRQADDAPRAALPAVASALWRAYAEGHVSEAEAEALAAHIEVRKAKAETVSVSRSLDPGSGTGVLKSKDTPQGREKRPRTGTGSRPRTDASLERRRRWAASGRLPPALASRFTLSEQAALSLIAAETARRGDCRLSIPHMAALVGIAETTVRNAIREARQLGLLTVEERRVTGFRNDTNVVRIVSPEWTAWLRLARKGITDRDPLSTGDGVQKRHPIASKGVRTTHPLLPQKGENVPAPRQRGGHGGPTLADAAGLLLSRERKGGGCKFANRTPTQVKQTGKNRRSHSD